MYRFMVLQLTQETELHSTRFAGEALIQMHIHVFVKRGRQNGIARMSFWQLRSLEDQDET